MSWRQCSPCTLKSRNDETAVRLQGLAGTERKLSRGERDRGGADIRWLAQSRRDRETLGYPLEVKVSYRRGHGGVDYPRLYLVGADIKGA